MKNFFKLSFALSALILSVSCEKEDDSNFDQKNYLSGKWAPVEMGELDTENILTYLPYENDAECDSDNIVLNENMTFNFSDFQYNGTTCDEFLLEGTYRREGKQLILTTMEEIDGVPTEVETTRNIVSLTYDTLEISYTDEVTNKITFLKLHKAN